MARDNDFDAGKSFSRDIGKGWARKIKTFLGLKMATKKVEIFRAHHFQWPE
jgi:hypothetical protein